MTAIVVANDFAFVFLLPCCLPLGISLEAFCHGSLQKSER